MYNNASFTAFLAEIVLDVVLSVLLVGFLNYQVSWRSKINLLWIQFQFEAAFRLSFYGDVQSRRDTERMQVQFSFGRWSIFTLKNMNGRWDKVNNGNCLDRSWSSRLVAQQRHSSSCSREFEDRYQIFREPSQYGLFPLQFTFKNS